MEVWGKNTALSSKVCSMFRNVLAFEIELLSQWRVYTSDEEASGQIYGRLWHRAGLPRSYISELSKLELPCDWWHWREQRSSGFRRKFHYKSRFVVSLQLLLHCWHSRRLNFFRLFLWGTFGAKGELGILQIISKWTERDTFPFPIFTLNFLFQMAQKGIRYSLKVRSVIFNPLCHPHTWS